MKKLKKYLILFDLDGVLIDSEKNMKFSWQQVRAKFRIKESFAQYKSYLGMSFLDIMSKLKIKKDRNKIKNYYKNISKLNLNLIRPYPGVVKTLKYLQNKKFIGILTSKDTERTSEIIKKFFPTINFFCIQSPQKKYRPKPAPDLILKIISKMNVDPSKCCYVGDSRFDKQMCKRAKIDFIYAIYGYGNKKIKARYRAKNIKDIPKFIEI